MIESLEVVEPDVFAIVAGSPLTELPEDLFIPPDALEILLDSFSGPLDLLLYLIRKQNIDILNIPMARITEQYMHYISLMKQKRLELAADYLAMAALLIEIKSRMLLPQRPAEGEEIEEDPRMALVKRLQVYEQFKKAASWLDDLPHCGRDVFSIDINLDNMTVNKSQPEVIVEDVVLAIKSIFGRQSHMVSHQVSREPLSVRERMGAVLEKIKQNQRVSFGSLYKKQEGEKGVIVSFLAILELAKQSLLTITQTQTFSQIHIKANRNE